MELIRALRLWLTIVMFGVLSSGAGSPSILPQHHQEGKVKILGTYEFVSQEFILTKPINERKILASPDWRGLWQFYNGHYSTVLMKVVQPVLSPVASAQSDQLDLSDQGEFEAFAGVYTVKGNQLVLTSTLAEQAFYVGQRTKLRLEIRGRLLVLTEVLRPHVEDMREGKIITTLKAL